VLHIYKPESYQFDRHQDVLFTGVVEEEELSVFSLFLFKIFLKGQLFQLFLFLVEKQKVRCKYYFTGRSNNNKKKLNQTYLSFLIVHEFALQCQ